MVTDSKYPPGPKGAPIIGHSNRFFRDPLEFGVECARDYGDVVSLQVAGQNAVQLSHPDHVKFVLEDNFEKFRKGEFYRKELELLGEGLLVSEGDLWRQQRSIIGPIFHPERSQEYFETMVSFAERSVDQLNQGESVPIEEYMQQLTLEIIAEALFSVDIRQETAGISDAVNDVMDEARLAGGLLSRIPEWMPTPGNLRYKRAIRTFDNVVQEIIENHRDMDNPPDDVVSRLLQAKGKNGKRISEKQIRDEVLTLLLAGHDTTALALGYIWYLLGKSPEIQSKLYKEIKQVIGNRSVKFEDIGNLDLTGRVVKEALRLYPPVYLFAREPKVDVEIGGYEIPKGTLLLFNQWVIHRDDRFFSEPHTFTPDRWSNGLEKSLPPYAYYPFSGGPRQCIGKRFAMLEIQIIIATFFKQFKFDLAFEPPLSLDPKVSLRTNSPVEVRPTQR